VLWGGGRSRGTRYHSQAPRPLFTYQILLVVVAAPPAPTVRSAGGQSRHGALNHVPHGGRLRAKDQGHALGGQRVSPEST
ncbi:hypothetical protein, partial [Sulfobacillus harzensis]|uniref:hypothetical protein n=1 Tax=Sulfobacillus harzensis TaxID=2729629 RepID=UPI001A9A7EC3